MNHFFAIKPPPDVCQALAEYAGRWRKELGDGRFHWYDSSDYHITLKFLGDLLPTD